MGGWHFEEELVGRAGGGRIMGRTPLFARGVP